MCTDRQTDVTMLIATFSSFANACKNSTVNTKFQLTDSQPYLLNTHREYESGSQ
jgi:hypothetical protein